MYAVETGWAAVRVVFLSKQSSALAQKNNNNIINNGPPSLSVTACNNFYWIKIRVVVAFWSKG